QITSATGSARAARLSHELAHARAPSAAQSGRRSPQTRCARGGTNMLTSMSLIAGRSGSSLSSPAGGSTAKPGWGMVPTHDQLSYRFGPRRQVEPRARSRSRPPRRPRAAAGPPNLAALEGGQTGELVGDAQPRTPTSSTTVALTATTADDASSSETRPSLLWPAHRPGGAGGSPPCTIKQAGG